MISGQPLYLLFSYSYLVAVAGAVPLTVALPTQATGNVRLHVTGNPPTTRELGFLAAHPSMLKGTVAVIIAGYLGGPNAAMLAALGAFLGHLFPVWLKFKGGKGVAVYIGVLIGLFWPAAVVFCVLWAATAATSRYSSLSALVASFVTPIFLWWFGHPALASLFAVLTLLLFYVHRENIRRLQAGTEGRIGE